MPLGATSNCHYHRGMSRLPQTTLFEDAIDVPAWLETERSLPLAERTHRDREIGSAFSRLEASARVRRWWEAIDHGATDLPGRRLEHARQWLNVAVALLGIVGGTGLALAAYRYDGTYPVNVVRVLGLLVAPQLAFLALNVVLLAGRVPGLGRLQQAIAAINPGAIAASIYNALTKRAGSTVFVFSAARSSAARRFAKWQTIFWSQIAAVGFNVAAIATAATLIAFTDLAFGWSTTLTIDADAATRIFAGIAVPWEAFAPTVVPDAELVERSQFFRLEGARGFDGGDSRALTAWWSFTLLAIVVYGLIPRLAFLALAAWRLRAATRALLLEEPQVTALLDRLSAPDVETRGAEASLPPRASADAPRSASPPAFTGTADAVIWGQNLDAAAAIELASKRLGLELGAIAEAGGGRSLDADRAALAAIDGAKTVLVFTPAWEPPLLEFADFLGALRKRIGVARSIVVVPVGEGRAPASALERETWTRAVNKVADSHIYVETGDT
jgi:hypothetical protein